MKNGKKIKRAVLRRLQMAMHPVAKILARWFRNKKQIKEETPARIEISFARSLIETGRIPNLSCPQSYNDIIHWLMLFDFDQRKPIYSDKINAKTIAAEKCPKIVVPKIISEAHSFADLDFSNATPPFFIKTNHDSGGTMLVTQETEARNYIEKFFRQKMSKIYGKNTNEWPYWQIKPKVFIEYSISAEKGKGADDYKFHCANGEVLWCQHIFDRGPKTKEINFSRGGIVIPHLFDHNFEKSTKKMIPKNYHELVEVAESLSEDFSYVRIDLFNEAGSIYFGEYTFFPLGGCYNSRAQSAIFGPILRRKLAGLLPNGADAQSNP